MSHPHDFIPAFGTEECRFCPRSLEQLRCCKVEDAAARLEDTIHELQVVTTGLEAAALLGLPPEAGPLVAAVLYAPELEVRKAAAAAVLEYLEAVARRLVA